MIHIFDKYYIEVDSMNYTALQVIPITTGKQKGKTRKLVIGYFPNLEFAIQDILEHAFKKKLEKLENAELKEIIALYEKCKSTSKYENLLQKAKKDLKKY